MQGACSPSPDSLCQLTSLIVSHVSGGCSDEAVHTVCLQELRHIEAHKHFLVVEKLPAQSRCASIHERSKTMKALAVICADIQQYLGRQVYLARARAVSVLPTPVGPRKRKQPVGKTDVFTKVTRYIC
jgi:hypothetical protein